MLQVVVEDALNATVDDAVTTARDQASRKGIQIGVVQRVSPPIGRASELMVSALLEDHKIITCGNGVDAALAQLFACYLTSRFEHERPALPALALTSDGAGITAIAHTGGLNDIYARQLRALGQPGDVLLCISSAGEANNLLRAAQAAHEWEMAIVVLVLLFLTVGIVKGGLVFHNWIVLTDAVRSGARVMSINRVPGVDACAKAQAAVRTAAGRRTTDNGHCATSTAF